MQGKKTYQEKLFACFSLSERIPKDNFYRQLGNVLDLNYLYRLTKPYYGVSGQKSEDPVVFFKLQLRKVSRLCHIIFYLYSHLNSCFLTDSILLCCFFFLVSLKVRRLCAAGENLDFKLI